MYIANDNYNNQMFKVGVYLRLSRDDEDKQFRYSDSILNQKDFLTRYVIDNNWCLVDYYIDDGYTGTNFDRPDFKRMIRDTQSKRINMIISKDMSRLGRDHIETSYYIEKYFPTYGIRYVAVTDSIDTFAYNNSNNDMSPFKSVVNDMYARDISKKVRAIFDSKRLNGQFIGAFAPYGYKKSPENKNLLIVDENAAPNVKQIFDLYLSGNGYGHIANILDSQGILPPTAYKSQTGNYKNPKSHVALWNSGTIRRILTNPSYAGNLTQNRLTKVGYKINKLRNLPKNNWITVENTHEAIIDQESFDLVQEMVANCTVKGKQPEYSNHLLSGLIYCGDCGARMTFNKNTNGNSYTICSSYKRFQGMNLCTRHAFLERKLDHIIIDELRIMANMAVNLEEFEKSAKNKTTGKKYDDTANEIIKVEQRLVEIRKIMRKLYEDKLRAVIGEQDFIDMSQEYNIERSSLTKRLTTLATKNNLQNESRNTDDSFLPAIKSFVDFKDVDRATIVKLVDKIEIFGGNRLRIAYKFQKP